MNMPFYVPLRGRSLRKDGTQPGLFDNLIPITPVQSSTPVQPKKTKSTKRKGDRPKVGDTKVSNGKVYRFNQNHRWERADKTSKQRSPRKAVTPAKTTSEFIERELGGETTGDRPSLVDLSEELSSSEETEPDADASDDSLDDQGDHHVDTPSTADIDYLTTRGKERRQKVNAQVKELLDRGGPYSVQEQKLLANYSGRGNIGTSDASTNEYYTHPAVAKFAWNILDQLGFKGGTVLEPGCGTGVFLHQAKDRADTLAVGVEIDPTSSAVARELNPHAEVINDRLERFLIDNPDQTFDAVVGNVPFGSRMSTEDFEANSYGREWKDLDSLFVAKSMERLAPGGLMAVVVPTRIIEGKKQQKLREHLLKHGRLIGAYRLPDSAFKHSDSTVITDVLVMQRHPDSVLNAIASGDSDTINRLLDADFIAGHYFKLNPQNILGEVSEGKGQFGRRVQVVKGDVKAVIDKALPLVPFVNYPQDVSATRELQVGDIRYINGRKYRFNENHRWERVEDEVTTDPITVNPEDFGVHTTDEIDSTLRNWSAIAAIKPEHLQAYRDYAAQNDASPMPDYAPHEAFDLAIAVGATAKTDHERAKKTEAALLAHMIYAMQRNPRASHEDKAVLMDLLQRYRDKYNNPRSDRQILALCNDNPVLCAFIGAFLSNGGISDAFADPERVNQTNVHQKGYEDVVDATNAAQVLMGRPVTVDELADFWEGDPHEVQAQLLNDPRIGFIPGAEGQHRFCLMADLIQGDGYELIDRFVEQQLLFSPESSEYQKLQQQIEETQRKLPTPRSLEDMKLRFRQVGILFPLEALNQFLAQTDLGMQVAQQYLEQTNEITGEKEWKEVFIKKQSGPYGSKMQDYLIRYLNGDNIGAGSKTPEVKKEIKQLEQEFQDWLAGSEYRADVEDEYNRRFASQIQREYSDAPLDIDKISKPNDYLNWYNRQAVRQMAEQGRGIIAHDVGLGKALQNGTPVLTPEGWVPIEKLTLGQPVMNSSGGVSFVLGVYPQPEKELFKVTFSDGSEAVCCDEHLWTVQTNRDRNITGKTRTLTLAEIRQDYLRGDTAKYTIPMTQALEFPTQPQEIDPYVLGLLLGDGCLSESRAVQFSNPESELIERLQSRLSALSVALVPKGGDNCDYRISTTITEREAGCTPNLLTRTLRRMGLLGKRAEAKFIPHHYLFASFQQRLALFQGLMDTDGSTYKANSTGGSTTLEFSTTSRQLSEGVKFLVQSFGGWATVYEKQPFYTYNGERRRGQTAYRLNISLPPEIVPFRLERKLAAYKPRTKYLPTRRIRKIESVGMGQSTCIKVSSADSLFLINDCILTHNTPTALNLALLLKQQGKATKTAIVVPKSVLANWVREIQEWCPDAKVQVLGMSQKFWGDEPAWEVPGYEIKESRGMPLIDDEGNYQVLRIAYAEDDAELETYLAQGYRGRGKGGEPKADKEGRYELVIDDSLTREQIEKIGNLAFVDDKNKAVRNAKLIETAQNDFDIVLMSEPMFQSIKLDPRNEYEQMQKLIGSHIQPTQGNKKEFYKLKDQAQEFEDRLNARRFKNQIDPELLVWEDLGIDCLIHDEAHHLRNLFSPKRNQSVSGINIQLSKRGLDFFYKANQIRSQNNGQNVYLLTATPTVNNPLEAYNMLMQVAPDIFDKMGIATVDDFLETFGKIESRTMLSLSGETSEKTKLVGFQLLRDLRRVFHGMTRLRNATDVNLPLPENNTITHTVQLSPSQQEAYEDLRSRAKEMLSGETGEDDHIFAVLADMDKAAIDLDYYNETTTRGSQFPNVEGRSPKIEACVGQVMQSYRANGAGQIIFCDAIQLHNKIKRQLIAAGMPADQIAIVNAKTTPESSDRQAISNQFNNGQISVVIGNTATMGEGINLQKNCSDIHQLDIPWTPASIKQRLGRGIRQGNKRDSVTVHNYHADQSIDAYRAEIVNSKQNWINDLWTGDKDETENPDTGGFNVAEIEAALSDDPEAARKAMEERRREQEATLAREKKAAANRKYQSLRNLTKTLERLQSASVITPKQEQDMAKLKTRIADLRRSLKSNAYFENQSVLQSESLPPIYDHPQGQITIGSLIQVASRDGKTYYQIIGENQDGKLTVKPFANYDKWRQRYGLIAGDAGQRIVAPQRLLEQVENIISPDHPDIAELINTAKLTAKGIAHLPTDVYQHHRDTLQQKWAEQQSSQYVFLRVGDGGLLERTSSPQSGHGLPMPGPDSVELALRSVAAALLKDDYWAARQIEDNYLGYLSKEEVDRRVDKYKAELEQSMGLGTGGKEVSASPESLDQQKPPAQAAIVPTPSGSSLDLAQVYQKTIAGLRHLNQDRTVAVGDADFAESLLTALDSGQGWTKNQFYYAARLVERYRNTQLGHLDLPEWSEIKGGIDQLSQEDYLKNVAKREVPTKVGTMEYNPSTGKVKFKFPKNNEILDRVRAIPGRQWDPTTLAWYVPIEFLGDHLDKFDDFEMINPHDLYEGLRANKRSPHGHVERRGNELYVSFPYSQRTVAKFKSLPIQRKWDGANKRWVVKHTPEAVEILRREMPDFSYDLTEALAKSVLSASLLIDLYPNASVWLPQTSKTAQVPVT